MPERKNKAKLVEFTCPHCGKVFYRGKHRVLVARPCCSMLCSVRNQPRRGGRQPKPIEPRFWARVDKSPGYGPRGDCWVWTGGVNTDGYGGVGVKTAGKHITIGAHRASWEIHNGPIPKGLCVLHHCDNPPCVRPDHLFLGTNTDNMQDMAAKGRARTPGPALTPTLVREIRARKKAGETLRSIAAAYGRSEGHVSDIIHRRQWKSVT